MLTKNLMFSHTENPIVIQQQAVPSLPSPPPTIVQSMIPMSPMVSQSPIVAPVPKMQAPRVDVKQEPKPIIVSSYEQPAPIINAPVTVKTMTTSSPTITTVAPPYTNANVVYSEHQTTTITSSSQNPNSKQEQENEQFALAWLRATFEPHNAPMARFEQQDLYKMYLPACSKIGQIGAVSQYHFPRCVRSVFGTAVGPNQIKNNQNGNTSFFYEGIRIRKQPLAVVHKGTILVSFVRIFSIIFLRYFSWAIL